jgi:TPR repeat protein
MEETLREELLAKTKLALDADDWDAVARLWQPWIDQGDAEAEYQLAYHYLWCTPCEDDATRERMEALIRDAAAKDHPDAIWFQATHQTRSRETNSELDRLLLRAGQLGSVNAQRELGAMYATGDWSGPKDLVEAARWYRLAAEKGDARSQYDLGFMLLLGEGEPKNTEEGLAWLERAGGGGENTAFRLLADCYENGYYDVPADAEKAALWRSRLEEYERLNPPGPSVRYSIEDGVSESTLERLLDIEGVTGFAYMEGAKEINVGYDSALIAPAELDEKIRAAGIPAVPTTERQG